MDLDATDSSESSVDSPLGIGVRITVTADRDVHGLGGIIVDDYGPFPAEVGTLYSDDFPLPRQYAIQLDNGLVAFCNASDLSMDD
ncbi:hypothetical protein GOEFS_003_00010 [Gordonia effusa NBRC 100432]|uniref:Uncharacterized protein n=1 Tax=Gordonia effusa NBRC 100432 TaxID=1077974 RepID=H0QUH6_9ACTN|nr:hypothetical protein [Gordonia effusa]GAB16477.1 hypothetical protein GOEFS_003_00010 [Gordonia effusa NBRC 100432]